MYIHFLILDDFSVIRNFSFIGINLLIFSLIYFQGQSFTKLIFYSIEKEFFPLKNPCENLLVLKHKKFGYLNYEKIIESERNSDL